LLTRPAAPARGEGKGKGKAADKDAEPQSIMSTMTRKQTNDAAAAVFKLRKIRPRFASWTNWRIGK